MDKELLTIISPIKDAMAFLEAHMNRLMSISSELGIKLLIIDNNSHDSELNYVRQLAVNFSHLNIKYEKNLQDLGVHGSLQKALKMVTTPYVTYVAADDVIFKDYIVRALNVLEADESISLVWGQGYMVELLTGGSPLKRVNPFSNLGEGKITGNSIRALLSNYPVDTGLVVRTDDAIKVGGLHNTWHYRIQELGASFVLESKHFINGKHPKQESKRMISTTEHLDSELKNHSYLEQMCYNSNGSVGLLAARLFNAARLQGGDFVSVLFKFFTARNEISFSVVKIDTGRGQQLVDIYLQLIMYQCLLDGETLKYRLPLVSTDSNAPSNINVQIKVLIKFHSTLGGSFNYSSVSDFYRHLFS